MRALLGLAPLLLAGTAAAQDHSMHGTPAAQQPVLEKPDPHAGHDMPKMDASAKQDDPPVGHDMSDISPPARESDPHAGHAMPAKSGTDLPAGTAPVPAPARERAADRYWGAAAMARAERKLRDEHGGGRWHRLLFDLAEIQVRDGRDGYRWEGEAWFGGDIDRVVIKTEGAGDFGARVDHAEIQALYGRALDPYWNLESGIRQDIAPGSRATYAALGVEGMAPYWLRLEATAFLSTKGDLLGRVEGSYDQRITQNLVLQPRTEANFAAQDMPSDAIGAGLSELEFGLRLRYERTREFAPYVGISWDRKLGRTADYARARREGTGSTSFVAGIRAWF